MRKKYTLSVLFLVFVVLAAGIIAAGGLFYFSTAANVTVTVLYKKNAMQKTR